MGIALLVAGTALFGPIAHTHAEGAAPGPESEQSGSSQEPQTEPSAALRVFLDCLRCDQDFLRTEITFVDFVRDRQDAQVHVLVTTQATGGGTEYTLWPSLASSSSPTPT